MSKQTGIIKLEGNLGGISFYSAAGQQLARVATGPSKERIAKDKAFKRTRENNNEFGGSAKAAKALRTAMGSVLSTMAGTRLVAQLTAVFKSINLKSPGIRGKRPIKLSTNRPLLKNVEFNKGTSFNARFNAPFTGTVNTQRNEATIIVPAFNPDNAIHPPSGATHFKLVAAIGIVSDYIFDATTNSYEPSQPLQDALGSSTYSDALPIDQLVPETTLVASVTTGATVNTQCSAVVALGIEFYQEVDSVLYVFAQDSIRLDTFSYLTFSPYLRAIARIISIPSTIARLRRLWLADLNEVIKSNSIKTSF